MHSPQADGQRCKCEEANNIGQRKPEDTGQTFRVRLHRGYEDSRSPDPADGDAERAPQEAHIAVSDKKAVCAAFPPGPIPVCQIQRPAFLPAALALDLMRHLAYLDPDVPDYRFALAGILMNLGLTQRRETSENNETAASFAEGLAATRS